MSARFEIVQTDAEQPWHARFIAANGEPVWSTENYAERGSALNAINVLASVFKAFVYEPAEGVRVAVQNARDVEIRDVDERVQ